MTDDELDRMCSFCSTVVHPDDELHPATRPSFRSAEQGAEPEQLCDFCYVSHGASAWLAGAAYPGEFMALSRTASTHANLLRADLRRFIGPRSVVITYDATPLITFDTTTQEEPWQDS